MKEVELKTMVFHRARILLEAKEMFWSQALFTECRNICRLLEGELEDLFVSRGLEPKPCSVIVGEEKYGTRLSIENRRVCLLIEDQGDDSHYRHIILTKERELKEGNLLWSASIHTALWMLVSKLDIEDDKPS